MRAILVPLESSKSYNNRSGEWSERHKSLSRFPIPWVIQAVSSDHFETLVHIYHLFTLENTNSSSSAKGRAASATSENRRRGREKIARFRGHAALFVLSKACSRVEVEQRRTSVVTRHLRHNLAHSPGGIISGERGVPYPTFSTTRLCDNKVEKRKRQD